METPRRRFLLATAFACVFACSISAASVADPLPSWNQGGTKQSIIEFVTKVTKKGSPEFVPPPERIATFDNDGTLWDEQPLYFQFFFALDRIKALAPQHPEWKDREPFASLLKGDVEGALAGGEKGIVEILAATHSGMTTEEFQQIVKDWIATARHPTMKRPFVKMVYQPMLELVAYLRGNGFKVFIVSGGGVEFMRPWTEQVYGIPPEQIVGSSGKLKFEMREGKPVLVKLPEISSTTTWASRSASSNISGVARSLHSATATAINKCSNGPAQARVRVSRSSCITTMPRASGRTIANPTWADSTRSGTKPWRRVGLS